MTTSPNPWQVYVLENATRGVFYVGITRSSLRRRLSQHKMPARATVDGNRHKKAVLRTEGGTIRAIAQVSTLGGAGLLERIAIAKLTAAGVVLTNLDAGGGGAGRWSPELKKRQSEHMRANCNVEAAVRSRRKPVARMAADGSVLSTHESVAAAARECGLRPAAISNHLAGLTRRTGGYRWAFAQERER